jgi:hypothetical protein
MTSLAVPVFSIGHIGSPRDATYSHWSTKFALQTHTGAPAGGPALSPEGELLTARAPDAFQIANVASLATGWSIRPSA